MKNVVIGTAGHVDHGKTLLIKALTGIDTDRLEEEKRRGITIELGFAHIDFGDGTRAGIVDVPGHEKFIRNMLMGAGGVDLAMLVVAADEGFMPQTVEHLGILSLLDIKDGLVAITKTDLVEPEWAEMIAEEAAERVRGTFLEGKPILPVSAVTGEGLGELREALRKMVQNVAEKNTRVPFRLPVDRVFAVDGFGTVVTGTLTEGSVSEGDPAELVPLGIKTAVRNLQVHGRDVTTAFAGQRVAMNLSNVKRSEVGKGDAVVKPGSLKTAMMLDARLRVLPESNRSIESGSQLHLYHGSGARMAKAVLLDREVLAPGQSCFAQLRLAEKMSAKAGDRFVVRFFSPLETIGGGVILDPDPKKHRPGDAAVLRELAVKETGSASERIRQRVAEHGTGLVAAEKLRSELGMEREDFDSELEGLLGRGEVTECLPGRFIAGSVLDGVWEKCKRLLSDYHAANPLQAGQRRAELRQKLFPKTERATADAILAEFEREGRIRRAGERAALADFEVKLTKRQKNIQERLLKLYRDAGIETPATEEVYAGFAPGEQQDARQVLESLVSGDELVMLAPQIVWHGAVYREVCGKTRGYFARKPELLLSDYRDLLGTSRKYALAVLEYFDRNRITKKTGDIRTLLKGFGEDID